MERSDSTYQVIIIVDYDDGRLFPLTEDIPKCLLPIANRKILGYQLDLLKACGATEIFIATPQDYQEKIAEFIAEEFTPGDSTMCIEIVPVTDMLGSADALRAVTDRIRGDFIVVNSDVICQINLGVLINAHCLKTSDVTMMLSAVPIEETIESNKKIKSGSSSSGGRGPGTPVKPTKIDEEDQEYIGICDDGRVMIKTPALEIDDESHLSFSKALLRKSCGSAAKLRFRCDLIDTGVYCMSYWILEFLSKRSDISTIRTDLLPYLVQRQYQEESYLYEHIPALQHRKRGLYVLEPWLVQSRAINGSYLMPPLQYNPSVVNTVNNVTEMSSSCFLSPIGTLRNEPESPNRCGISSSSIESPFSRTFVSDHTSKSDADDLLRCFAVLVESPTDMSPYPVVCQRVTNIQTYMNLNSFFPFASVPAPDAKSNEASKWFCYWGPYAGSQVSVSNSNTILKKEQSLLGIDVEMGEKVTLKNCTIGKFCKIGSKSKLNQSVVMQGVHIGENCTIQNCIISENVVIEKGCSLKHCHIGANVRLKEGSAIKQETISSSTITE